MNENEILETDEPEIKLKKAMSTIDEWLYMAGFDNFVLRAGELLYPELVKNSDHLRCEIDREFRECKIVLKYPSAWDYFGRLFILPYWMAWYDITIKISGDKLAQSER